ncbi:50S ribosomal protein L21 [Patescibacteria group bacterium]|nr:50S ribosomal protein L21 [Patescibacteria group bacterium]
MLAVFKTGGKQYKVSIGDKLKIEKIEAKEGDLVVFPEVLLLDNGKSVEIGNPFVKEAKVEAKVLKQAKGDKITIYKYKPKKRYQKKMGHRQLYTEIEITKLG